jgi:hypothetical protein
MFFPFPQFTPFWLFEVVRLAQRFGAFPLCFPCGIAFSFAPQGAQFAQKERSENNIKRAAGARARKIPDATA